MEKNNASNIPPRLKEKVEKVLQDGKFRSVLATMVLLQILASESDLKDSNDSPDSQSKGDN